jgi:hypothetical protein
MNRRVAVAGLSASIYGWSLLSAFGQAMPVAHGTLRGVSSLASALTPSSAAYQYGPYGKVTICHHADNRQRLTITISEAALPAHLAHGDTIGPCP